MIILLRQVIWKSDGYFLLLMDVFIHMILVEQVWADVHIYFEAFFFCFVYDRGT